MNKGGNERSSRVAQFEYNCPKCGESIVDDDSFRGHVTKCSTCGKVFVIPHDAETNRPAGTIDVPMRGNAPLQSDIPVPSFIVEASRQNIESMRDSFNREISVIKNTASIMLVREMVLLVTVALVIAGSIGGIWYHYKKRNQATQLTWQHELERQRQMAEERIRKDEAQKKAREEMLLARDRERQRIEMEKQAKEEARKVAIQRRKKFEALATDYREFELDYLCNAPKSTLPERVAGKTVYSCLMADDVDDFVFFRVTVTPGMPMAVQRLSMNDAPVDVSEHEFNERCRTETYLMIAGGRPYVSPYKKASRLYPIPHDGEIFNPGVEDLGSRFCKIITDLELKTNIIRYDVFLYPKDEYSFDLKPLFICQTGFGKGISVHDLRTPIRAKLEAKARERADEYKRRTLSRWKGYGKTRSQAALERNIAISKAGVNASHYRRSHTSIAPLPGHSIIYQSRNVRTGPSKYQLGKIADMEARLNAAEEARVRRQMAKEQRHAAEDEAFYRNNAVTEKDVDELLQRYMVTFRLAK